MMAELFREQLVWYSHLATLGFLDPQLYFLALYQIHRLPPSCLGSHLGDPSHHSSRVNFRYWKCCSVCYHHHLPPAVGPFSLVTVHSIIEFVLPGGSLRTNLVAEVINPTIGMQLQEHVEIWEGCINDHFSI